MSAARRSFRAFFTEWQGDDLQAKVRQFRKPFDELKPRQFDPALGLMLYQRLLMPVLGQVPEGTPLIIIPQGALSVLPFEALVVSGTPSWTSGPKGDHPTGLTYLGDRPPSATTSRSMRCTWSARSRPRSHQVTRAWSSRDPVFDTTDARAQKESSRKLSNLSQSLP